jgi:hypothetical protein
VSAPTIADLIVSLEALQSDLHEAMVAENMSASSDLSMARIDLFAAMGRLIAAARWERREEARA